MAREEHERENLLRDATAYVRRAEWRTAFCQEPVFVGLRADDCASFYFGQDEVFHFNTFGELRRGFIDGKLLKAAGGGLVELTRRRTDQEVQLVRRELSADELETLLARIESQLAALRADLKERNAILLGEVALEGDAKGNIAEVVCRWIGESFCRQVAARPNAE